MGKVFAIIFFCFISLAFYAQSDSAKRAIFKPYHNFRIGFGAFPEDYSNSDEESSDQNGDAVVKRGPEFYTHSLYMNYMYAHMAWLEYGVYGSFTSRRHSRIIYPNGVNRPSYTDLLITVMPALRINWLRKSWVNMYSSVAVGAYAHWNYQEMNNRNGAEFKIRPTAQLLLIGISVGKNLYGFADFFGIGSLGLVSFGVGYKLPSK